MLNWLKTNWRLIVGFLAGVLTQLVVMVLGVLLLMLLLSIPTGAFGALLFLSVAFGVLYRWAGKVADKVHGLVSGVKVECCNKGTCCK
jgi:hypothetical protein